MIIIPEPYYGYINLAFWLVVLYFVIAHIFIYTFVYLRDGKLPIVNPYECVRVFTKHIVYDILIYQLLLYYIYRLPVYLLVKFIRNNKKYRISIGGTWLYSPSRKYWYRNNEWPILLFADESEKEQPNPTLFTIGDDITIVEVYKDISDKECECFTYSYKEYIADVVIPAYKANNIPINYISTQGKQSIENFKKDMK